MIKNLLFLLVALSLLWSSACYLAIARAVAFWSPSEFSPPYAPGDHWLPLGSLGTHVDLFKFGALKFLVFAWLWLAFLAGILTAVFTLFHLVNALWFRPSSDSLEQSERVQILFAFAPLALLVFSLHPSAARRVVAKLLAHEFALLHILASILAIHVCITVPWPFEPGFLKAEFMQCTAFMLGTAFLLGLFQSTTDRGPLHPDTPYLLSQSLPVPTSSLPAHPTQAPSNSSATCSCTRLSCTRRSAGCT